MDPEIENLHSRNHKSCFLFAVSLYNFSWTEEDGRQYLSIGISFFSELLSFSVYHRTAEDWRVGSVVASI